MTLCVRNVLHGATEPSLAGRQRESCNTSRTVWPSGLRRWLKALFRKGVGSNRAAVTTPCTPAILFVCMKGGGRFMRNAAGALAGTRQPSFSLGGPQRLLRWRQSASKCSLYVLTLPGAAPAQEVMFTPIPYFLGCSCFPRPAKTRNASAARNDQRTQLTHEKGLRCRISPTCTFSQNGYNALLCLFGGPSAPQFACILC